MEMFDFPLPSVCTSTKKYNFLRKLYVSDNIICRLFLRQNTRDFTAADESATYSPDLNALDYCI